MSAIKFEELCFDHIVEFTKDNTIFAAARENGSTKLTTGGNGHLRLFLIYEASGNVYTRNGKADSWEEIYGGDRLSIIARLTQARSRGVAVYRINGAHN